MLDADRHVAAVEIAHPAGAHVRGANGQARLAAIDQGKVDEIEQRALERHGRIVPGVVGAERHVRSPKRHEVGDEETRNAAA